MDTALVKVGGRWRHRKSGGPPVRRVEPVDSAGGPVGLVAYSVGPCFYAHFVVPTPIKRLYRINERNFSQRRVVGFVGWPNFYPFADKKSIVHTLSLKEVFFWGIYKKKGLGLLEA